MTVPRYKSEHLMKYVIVTHREGNTIHFEAGSPRTRVTLDTRKWRVSEQLADSGSTLSILLTPKEKEGSALDSEKVVKE